MDPHYKGKNKLPSAVHLAAFVIIIAGVMYANQIINQILMALFVSIVCAQPVLWLKKKKVPQVLAVFMVFAAALSLFFGFGDLIANSLSSFSEDMELYEENLSEIGNSIIVFLGDKGLKISKGMVTDLFDMSKVMGFTANFLGQLGGFMGNALTIFFLALFLLLEIDSVSIKAKAIVKGSTESLSYFTEMGKSIRHYLSIKTVTSLLTGFLIWVLLAIVGVDYAIIWALIAFLMNYIPNIGSILAAIPAVIFAFVQLGFGGFIWTTGIFVAVNMIIGNAVEPRIMGQGLGLSTFVVFASLIIFGFILGSVGMFLSVPLTMAIKIMLEQNPETQWGAIILGTSKEAKEMVDKKHRHSSVL